MMDNLLLHRCTIQTRDASENTFGEQTFTWTDLSSNVHCRFSSPRGIKQRLDSGEFVTEMPKIFLKVAQDVSENCRIIGTSGFKETYEVLKVNTRYNTNAAHHIECDLRKVV